MTHKNLRPIRNLQFVSKITERAVFDQIYSHMTGNELFPVLQSAYRKGHSTETALLRVINDILSSMNKQHVSILVLLDLSAAFDTVDHAILLHRLETSFGITEAALAWFSSYLSGRGQCVSVNVERSDCYPLPFGVAQGSCLGPLLFSAYDRVKMKIGWRLLLWMEECTGRGASGNQARPVAVFSHDWWYQHQ